MKEYSKTDCTLLGTRYCAAINAPACEQCVAYKNGTDENAGLQRYVDTVRELLPRGTVSELTDSETCWFCKGEKQKKTCYALTDYAHKEPESIRRSVIGLKVRSSVGSLLSLQIACCDRCKKNIKHSNRIAYLVTVGGMVAALALLAVPPIREALAKIAEIVPIIVFLIISVLSFFLGRLAMVRAEQKGGRDTLMNTDDIPVIAEMCANGWFCAVPGKGGRVNLIFSKQRNNRGLLF